MITSCKNPNERAVTMETVTYSNEGININLRFAAEVIENGSTPSDQLESRTDIKAVENNSED